MNHLGVALAARAFESGRAVRAARYRHRHLVDEPVAIVMYQLGAEPFSVAALGWGCEEQAVSLAVAGEPRNRDLAFAAILKFARWFNPRFEASGRRREAASSGRDCACTAPQVVVANRASVEMIGRIGRRLAYLSPFNGKDPDPALVRLGRHLLFLHDHAEFPGQQLVVALTELLSDHWATPQSELERHSLAALDAYIEPPAGMNGFDAAALVEQHALGPLPAAVDDERLEPLLEEFNARRARSTRPTIVTPLLGAIESHYRLLINRTWKLIWRCRNRELQYNEAPSVGRRWEEDRLAYTNHLDWLHDGGLRRTRHTPRRAAVLARTLEEASSRVEAEEACDDPIRMIPYLIQNKSVCGEVIGVDLQHKEMGSQRYVRRPLIHLLSRDACLMPLGKELFWTSSPEGREFVVHRNQRHGEGTLVTLKLTTSHSGAPLPSVGSIACFSIHTTGAKWHALMPPADPWTHKPSLPTNDFRSLEEDAGVSKHGAN